MLIYMATAADLVNMEGAAIFNITW